MFKKSKLTLVAVAALLLAGCGGDPSSEIPSEIGGDVKDHLTVTAVGTDVESTVDDVFKPDATRKKFVLSVWSEVEAHPLFIDVLKEFVTDYAYDEDSNTVYEFLIRIGDEFSAAATEIVADLSVAPDVFGFPDDQTETLVNAGALAELTGTNKTWAVENNVETSIESATFNNKLYAYPQTADNGYFLYYNKNVLDLADVASWDKMLEALEEHSATRTDGLTTKIVFPFEDAWYIPSFFFHNHADDPTAPPVFAYDPATKAMTSTANDLAGQNAARGMEAILAVENQPYIEVSDVNGTDALFTVTDDDGNAIVPEAVAGVTGTWNAPVLSAAMGDGYAATKLPTFTPIAADGTPLPQQQMGSFAGSKLIGVKQQEDPQRLFFAHQIAQRLTSAETQIQRFENQGFGPSNIVAQEDPAVKADVANSALALQNEFAVSQSRTVSGAFWDPAAAFGKLVVAQEYGEGLTLVDALDAWIEGITA